jgi:hypothetical protein
MHMTTSYLSRIRGVPLLPGETVSAMLDAGVGLVAEPTARGHVLVATNRRLISATSGPRANATEMYAGDSISGLTIRDESRRGLSWRQRVMLVAGGALIYLVLAYWLVDRLPGPVIPVINIHAVALVLLALTVIIGGLIWRGATYSGGRQLRITGVGWVIELASTAPSTDLIAFATVLIESQAGGQRFDDRGRPPLSVSLSVGDNTL